MPILTIQPGATGQDTTLNRVSPTFNYGANTSLFTSSSAGSEKYALVKFDLSSIPSNAIITSAIFTIFQITSSNPAVLIYRITSSWFEGVQSAAAPTAGQDGSTWNHRNANGSIAWNGGVGSPDISISTISAIDSANVHAGACDADLTTEVQAVVNGSVANNGWAFRSTGSSIFEWASSDNATAANRPMLVVTYNLPAASARGSTVAPTTVKGSVSLTPDAQTAVGAVDGPSAVNIGYYITPAAASAVGTAFATGSVFVYVTPAPRTSVGASSGPTSTIKGSVVLTPEPASAVGEQGGFASLVDRTLRPAASDVWGSTSVHVVAQRIWAELCEPKPLLYISDGSIRGNGQQDLLSLIDSRNGFVLNSWNPTVAQYKNGGTFSNSPLARGRRLVRREFDNAIEIMDLKIRSHNQESLIQFTRDYFRWQEQAAEYWVSDWSTLPVYLVAKSARERNIRYAIIYMMSIPELANPYNQPFFSNSGKSSIEAITLRIERGDWEDSPPGYSQCVAVSSIRSWTVQGWQNSNTSAGGDDTVTGNVLSMVQAANGDVLIGTSDQAKIYRSTNNGTSWSFLTKFAGVVSTDDRVRALAKDGAGNLYAAVTGSSVAQGIWKSSNNGVSWTRVKTHPAGTGYLDITVQQGNRITAAGGPTPSSATSPMIFSNTAGVTWVDISTPDWHRTHMSVAAPPEQILFTQIPQEAYPDVSTFIGVDGFYTSIKGVKVGTYPPTMAAFGTYGGAGNGGLDMVSFLAKNSSNGNYYRYAIWAVRSALDTNDTEIWYWPQGTLQSGSTNFSLINTIDGKIFNVLYVDPTPGASSPTRTIWAGANGEIWVSYNSGITWALATDAPVNQIRSFLRTSSGTLLAGGDNSEIFVYTGTGSQGGGGVQDEINYGQGSVVVSTYPLGREATCADEVYASNKSAFSNITHVLHYNGSTYSELQFATQPPYSLLGTTAVVNKAAYFGSKTSDPNVPGSPFSGLVFEVTQKAENITVVWEYWNGSAWVALTVQDSSSGFKIDGGGSVHWVIPTNWTTVAVNGITGYWVRVRTSAVAASPVTPVHGTALHPRFIYTPNLPYIEVAASEIGGDLPAGAQILWRNRGDDPVTAIDMEVDRVVCGLRSVDRGFYFNAYLNISDVQTPFGFSLTKHADGTWGSSVRAPTNRALTVSHSSGVELNKWNDLVTFNIANTVARDFYGTYHAFVRVNKTGAGTNNWQLRLRTSFGTGGAKKDSHSAFPTLSSNWEAVDLGEVSIPTAQVSRLGQSLGDLLKLTVQGYCTATGVAIVLYDLILIPVDEWAVDTLTPEPATSDAAKVKGDQVLDIDSITNPKVSITATNRTSGDLIVARYQAINNGPAVLQRGSDQRLWFLVMSWENYWRAYPEVAGSIRVNKRQRYLGYRGAN